MPKISLRERILKAESWNEVSLLIMEGDTFEKPSKRTKRRWKEAAQKRKQELLTEG